MSLFRHALRSAVILVSLAAGASAGEPFVYQGRLVDNGQAADGVYDIKTDLYTAAAGGSSVSTTSFDNVTVSDGVFSVSLPFPPSNEARWIGVSVRPGTSTGAYTTLSPRQYIAAGPFASFALNAPWVLSGSTMSYGDGDDVVLINRTNRIGSEFFGVGGNTSSFAGMYVSTTGPTGMPFYGYSAGGDIDAYHFFNGGSDTFDFIMHNQTMFSMSAAGDADIAGSVEAGGFSYSQAETRTFSISGNTFTSASGDPFIAYANNGPGLYSTTTDGTAWFTAPVNLPDGATITRFSAYSVDNSSSGYFNFVLVADEIVNGVNSSVATLSTSSLSNSSVVRESSMTVSHIVDNDRYAYFVVGIMYNAPGNTTLRLVGARINYTVTKPD